MFVTVLRSHIGPVAAALVLSVVVDTSGKAQHPEDLDSLLAVHRDVTRPDSVRTRALLSYLFERRYGATPDSLAKVLEHLIPQLRNIGLRREEAGAWNFKGVSHRELGQWDSAEACYGRSYAIWQQLGDTGRMAGILNNLGNVASYKGDDALSIEYLTRALKLGEAMADSSVIARALGNIGVAFYEQGEDAIALDYFQRRIAVAEAIGDEQCALEAWICIGMTKERQGRLEEARDGYEKSLAIARRMNDVTSITTALGSLGKLEMMAGRHEAAVSLLDSSLKLALEHQDEMLAASATVELTRSWLQQGMVSEALRSSERALRHANAFGGLEVLRDAREVRYRALKQAGRSAEALFMHESYIAARDSFVNEGNRRNLLKQRFQYEYEKKEALLAAEQEKKDAIAAEALRRKQLQRNASIGGFGLMLLLAGVFFTQRNRISREKARSEALLLNILPEEVADELKEKGEAQAIQLDHVTVLFTDFKGFTSLSENLTPRELVRDLNECFSAFDRITEKYGIEKIKTIGDAYMAAGGLPVANATHAVDTIKAALEMRDFIEEGKQRKIAAGKPYFEIRIGVHTGPVVAGIVGVKKFQYDIWGDTVNTASRMESSGEVGKVNISEATYRLVVGGRLSVDGHTILRAADSSNGQPATDNGQRFTFIPRGKVQAKGKGAMEMFFVERA